MDISDEIWNEIDKIVDQVLALSSDLKASMDGVYSEDNLHKALVTLIVLETALYKKLATISKRRTTYEIVEFASIARLLLESHATICWILDSEGDQQTRSTQFMETGWDLQKHYNSLTVKGYGLTKRTRSRLPSTEQRMKTMNSPELVNWYDELNFYIHPSAAIITQHFTGGLPRVVGFGIWIAGNVYADSILKVSGELNLPAGIISKAEVIHTLDVDSSDEKVQGDDMQL